MSAKPLYKKLIACFLAGIIGAYSITEAGRKIFIQWLPIVTGISGLFFISCVGFAAIWHYKEKKQKINSLSVSAFLQWVICYFIAIDLSMFAMRKIFHLQLYAPTALIDRPFSSLSGDQLSEAFFGYSYPYVLCIACVQLIGAFLLLFKKTRLLGTFILLPVLVNIILTDIFYNIEIGALLQASALTLGLFYIMYDEYDRIKEFFLSTKNSFPLFRLKSSLLENLLRFSTLFVPFVICVVLYDFPNRNPGLTGKYNVENIVINHNKMDISSCKDSVLTIVYIDDNNDLVFEYNSQKRRKVGHFKFDKNIRQLKAVWGYPKGFHDTLLATASKLNAVNKMTLAGIMGRDTLTIDLLKIK